MFIWPYELSCYYPLPEKINGILPHLFMWSVGLTGILIGGLIGLARRSKLAAFGMFFYVISMAPILGTSFLNSDCAEFITSVEFTPDFRNGQFS